MAAPLFAASMASAIPNLAGGLVSAITGRNQRRSEYQRQDELAARGRKDYEKYRDEERRYAEYQTRSDRRYAKSVLDEQRRYSEYVLRSDRRYLDDKLQKDMKQYFADRDFMQNRSNKLAEKSAASRGVDFTRLRDDAVKAGYNPMTALGMAHAYSTHVDYGLQGSVYSPQANYTATGSGSGMASGGAAVPMSHVPAGGSFTNPGSGYTSNSGPQLAAGQFVAEAMERATDTFFNTPPADDKLTAALRTAMDAQAQTREAESRALPAGGFGWQMPQTKPFNAAVSAGVPAMRRNQSLALQPAKPSPSDDLVNPSEKSIRVGGRDFDPASDSSDAAAVEERYGDIPSGLYGVGMLAYDMGSNARRAYEKARGRDVYKIDGEYYMQAPDASPRLSDYARSGRTGSKPMILNGRMGYKSPSGYGAVGVNRRRYNGY